MDRPQIDHFPNDKLQKASQAIALLRTGTAPVIRTMHQVGAHLLSILDLLQEGT